MLNDEPRTYEVEILNREDAEARYTLVWNTARKLLPHLQAEDTACIVSLVVDTCKIALWMTQSASAGMMSRR